MTVSPATPPVRRGAVLSVAAEANSVRARELTARAVISGCLIGGVLAIGNVYMGLKTGWADQGNITAAILGFALFAALRRPGSREYTPLENNVTQTVASSAAGMSFTTGLVGAFPALGLLGHTYPGWALALWGIALGAVGILVAVMLRDRLIVREELPFPSGIATARLIEVMHRAAGNALRRARTLVASAGAAMAMVWFRDGQPRWIPQATRLPLQLAASAPESLAWGISWSPLLVGTGLLIGPRNGLSVLAGAFAASLAPLGVTVGWIPPGDPSALSGWVLWPGVALMASAALTSLALQWRTFARGVGDLARFGSRGTERSGRGIWLPGAAVGLVVLLGWRIFEMNPLFTLAVVVLSVVLASVCARATGETDIAPVTQMGQLTQVSVGAFSGQLTSNLLSGSIAADSTQTAQMLWTFKTGHLLGGNQRRLIAAQFIGMVVGAVAVVPAYQLFSRVYGLGTEALPVPTALAWKGLAELVHGGVAAVPTTARVTAAFFAAIGILLTLADRGPLRRLTPSAVAMGVGFLNPVSYAVAIAAGSVALAVARRWKPSETEEQSASIASGLIAGESILAVLIAVLVGVGMLSTS